MPITIADVAARAGVSKTTVSRVLNGKGELDIATANRVRQVIDELGYVPSARAVGLARGRTRIVGMLVPSLTWPWIGDVVQGAVDVLESESYGLLLFTCNRGEESMRQFATHVSAKSFDGLLVIEPENTLDYIAELHERGLPVVLIDDRGHQPQFPSVATTNYYGGQLVARHLVSLGRTRPLVITGIEDFGCTQERLDGFRAVYDEAGIDLDKRLVVEGDFTFDCGRHAVKQAIAAGIEFDAIFAHNDLSAVGAMQAARELGRRDSGRHCSGRIRRRPGGRPRRASADHHPPATPADGGGRRPHVAVPFRWGTDASRAQRDPGFARGPRLVRIDAFGELTA